MGNADARALTDPIELNRRRVGGERDILQAGLSEIVQLFVKDHVLNVAHHAMPLEILHLRDGRVRREIDVTRGQVQLII